MVLNLSTVLASPLRIHANVPLNTHTHTHTHTHTPLQTVSTTHRFESSPMDSSYENACLSFIPTLILTHSPIHTSIKSLLCNYCKAG
jgi:hypothetical protein